MPLPPNVKNLRLSHAHTSVNECFTGHRGSEYLSLYIHDANIQLGTESVDQSCAANNLTKLHQLSFDNVAP